MAYSEQVGSNRLTYRSLSGAISLIENQTNLDLHSEGYNIVSIVFSLLAAQGSKTSWLEIYTNAVDAVELPSIFGVFIHDILQVQAHPFKPAQLLVMVVILKL